MKNPPCRSLAFCVLSAVLWLWTTRPASAQFTQQGGGRVGGTARGTTGATGAREYPSNTEVGEAMISSDRETRKIIVITDEDTNLQIQDVISNLDRPKPQVLIKVVFVEIVYNNASDIGVEGGFRNESGDRVGTLAQVFGLSGLNSSATGAVNNALGQNIQSFVPTPPGAGLYQILGQDYQVTLRAIAQAGKAEVISRPSVLARNSQPATITVGQSVPLITNVRFDTFGNAVNSVTYTDVGIILRVTPFITTDGLVEMIISPELSSVSRTDTVPISLGVQAPVIDKRSADTVVVTPDRQTVIIGGLMGRTKAQSDSKIPILGDLPYLGAIFRRRVTSDVKTELVIFLTPHIVQAPDQLSAVSESERSKLLLQPQQVPEEELNKFLDGLPEKGATPPDEQPAKKAPKSNGRKPNG